MSLPAGNRFQSVVTNAVDGTQPTSTYGTLVAAGGAVNTYGALTTLIDAPAWAGAGDAYEVEIHILANWASANARNSLVTIAVDGVDFIVDLAAAKAGTMHTWGGIAYRFPVRIATGSVVAAKVQTGDAALPGLYVAIRLHCDPTKRWLLRTGTFVRTLGADLVNTLGTPVVVGAGAEGAWTSVGILADDVWFWEVGWMTSDTAINANVVHLDVGLGVAKDVALRWSEFHLGTTETTTKPARSEAFDAATGTEVFVRAQSGGGGEVGDSAIVYAVGGRFSPPTPYTVAGTISIATIPVGAGKTVQIFAVDSDGVAELVATATTDGSGAFTASVPDNTRSYFASYNNDGNYGRSALGTPV